MFDHPQLSALLAILDFGSFDAAAHYLGVTPSAVSQRVRALEERVGGPVLTRTVPPAATELGRRIARHAGEMARLNAELAEALGEKDRLAVKIAVNADSLDTWFLPALAGHDQRLVRLIVEDQDHTAELLRRGEVAAAVTSHEDPVQGADCVALGRLRYVATASPAFVKQCFPDGLSVRAFERAPALAFNAKDSLQADWAADRMGRRVVLPCHYLPSTRGFVDAARLGVGWGMNPEPLVRDAIRSGDLVELAPDAFWDTALFWQSSRIGAEALMPLTRAVRRAAARVLYPPA